VDSLPYDLRMRSAYTGIGYEVIYARGRSGIPGSQTLQYGSRRDPVRPVPRRFTRYCSRKSRRTASACGNSRLKLTVLFSDPFRLREMRKYQSYDDRSKCSTAMASAADRSDSAAGRTVHAEERCPRLFEDAPRSLSEGITSANRSRRERPQYLFDDPLEPAKETSQS